MGFWGAGNENLNGKFKITIKRAQILIFLAYILQIFAQPPEAWG